MNITIASRSNPKKNYRTNCIRAFAPWNCRAKAKRQNLSVAFFKLKAFGDQKPPKWRDIIHKGSNQNSSIFRVPETCFPSI